MNRNKLLVIAVVGLLFINVCTLVFLILSKNAAQRPFQGPHRGEGPKQIIIERLGFNEEQQKAYMITIDAHRRKTRELEAASRELHERLFSLLKDADYQQESQTLIQAIADNQKEIDQLNFNHFLEIKALCKGKQVEKFNVLVTDLARLFAPEGPPH